MQWSCIMQLSSITQYNADAQASPENNIKIYHGHYILMSVANDIVQVT